MMGVAMRTQGYQMKNGSPTTEYNKALVRRLYSEVWNEKDLQKMAKAVEKLIGEEHVLVDPSNPNPVDGVESYKEMVMSMRETMPNVTTKIDMLIAEGSKVTALLTCNSGTLPDNSKTAVWTATSIVEFAGGQAVKTWVNSDALSALIQLDLVPDMASGPFKRSKSQMGVPKVDSHNNVVDALLGRKDQHPTTVLTADEWLDYFIEQAERASTHSATNTAFQKDQISGLDMAV